MELVHANDPVLHTVTEKFDFANPPFEPIEFAKNLIEFMYEKNGIGLSANQCGIPYNIFAMRGNPENFVCFNAKIVWAHSSFVLMEEVCLSYPGFVVPVSRAKEIRIRFQTPNSEWLTKVFIDMTARVCQHEMMHLIGKNFWSGVSKLSFDRARKKCGATNITYNGIILENLKKTLDKVEKVC
jgi:peptide deformylase